MWIGIAALSSVWVAAAMTVVTIAAMVNVVAVTDSRVGDALSDLLSAL